MFLVHAAVVREVLGGREGSMHQVRADYRWGTKGALAQTPEETDA